MTTKFNVGDTVYAYDPNGGQPFIIFATIHSIEISEQIFELEESYREDIRKELNRKINVATYIFKLGENNYVKVPEAFYNWHKNVSERKSEVKELLPLVFSTQEELNKYINILK